MLRCTINKHIVGMGISADLPPEFRHAVNVNCWIAASNHTCHCEISALIANIMQAVAVQAILLT